MGKKEVTGVSEPQRRIRIRGEGASSERRGFSARTRQTGKASHRGHRGFGGFRGHGGGVGLEVKGPPVNGVDSVREAGEQGKHRTEVTEATEETWAVGANLFSGQCGFKCENSRSFSSTEF